MTQIRCYRGGVGDEGSADTLTHIRGYPNIRFLCLTSYADASLVLAAMEAGVDGYLLKHSDAHRIAAAVREVLAGTPVFDPALDVVSARDEAGRASRNPLSFL